MIKVCYIRENKLKSNIDITRASIIIMKDKKKGRHWHCVGECNAHGGLYNSDISSAGDVTQCNTLKRASISR